MRAKSKSVWGGVTSSVDRINAIQTSLEEVGVLLHKGQHMKRFKICIGTAFYEEVPKVKELLMESDLIVTSMSADELQKDLPGKTIVQLTGRAEDLVDPNKVEVLFPLCSYILNPENEEPLSWEDVVVYSYNNFKWMQEEHARETAGVLT